MVSEYINVDSLFTRNFEIIFYRMTSGLKIGGTMDQEVRGNDEVKSDVLKS